MTKSNSNTMKFIVKVINHNDDDDNDHDDDDDDDDDDDIRYHY